MAKALQPSFPERPSSFVVCYIAGVRYQGFEYRSTTTVTGVSDEAWSLWEYGETTGLAASVNNAVKKLVSAVPWARISQTQIFYEKARIWDEGHCVCANNPEKVEHGEVLTEYRSWADAHAIKVEDIVERSEKAASSALREERSTEMSTPVNAIPSLPSIYYIESINLVEKNELGVGNDLSGKEDLVLADFRYDVWKDRKK